MPQFDVLSALDSPKDLRRVPIAIAGIAAKSLLCGIAPAQNAPIDRKGAVEPVAGGNVLYVGQIGDLGRITAMRESSRYPSPSWVKIFVQSQAAELVEGHMKPIGLRTHRTLIVRPAQRSAASPAELRHRGVPPRVPRGSPMSRRRLRHGHAGSARGLRGGMARKRRLPLRFDGAPSSPASYDGAGTPEPAEDFEELWKGNEGFAFDLSGTSTQTATYDSTGTPEPVEDFEELWPTLVMTTL